MLILYMSFIDDEIHRRLFEKIYMTYRKQMFLVARAVLSNDSDAEDAVHDVFLKIAKSQMQKIGSIQEAADIFDGLSFYRFGVDHFGRKIETTHFQETSAVCDHAGGIAIRG